MNSLNLNPFFFFILTKVTHLAFKCVDRRHGVRHQIYYSGCFLSFFAFSVVWFLNYCSHIKPLEISSSLTSQLGAVTVKGAAEHFCDHTWSQGLIIGVGGETESAWNHLVVYDENVFIFSPNMQCNWRSQVTDYTNQKGTFLHPETMQAFPELYIYVSPQLISDPQFVPLSNLPSCRWSSMLAVGLAYCPCSLPDLEPRRSSQSINQKSSIRPWR